MPTMIPLICTVCNTNFLRPKRLHWVTTSRNSDPCCSNECARKLQTLKGASQVSCANCNDSFIRQNSHIKKSKSGNSFCSKSCAATYNNKHKAYGIRRSKLEHHIEYKLKQDFPELSFLLNNKKIIGSELDFYFPDYKLAIEINGIFHHKPIFGKNKLKLIQDNDANKVKECKEKGISLVIIDVIEDCRSKAKLNHYWQIFKSKLAG